jgi:hypothetical protein
MAKSKKEEKRFTFEGKDYVIKPINAAASIEAQKVYNKAFKRAIEEGAILKKSLEDHMRRQGLWDDSKQEEYESLLKKSAAIEYKIKNGEYKKASEVRDKSIELKRIRNQLTSLLMIRNSMDSTTADGHADNERFFYLITACIYDYENQKPVYTSLDDYHERSETELAAKCATEFANFAYGLEENYEDKLIENKLLKKLGLLDDEGHLTNKKGQRVDLDGNLLNEDGARIDENGNRIDINNNPIIDDAVIDDLEFEDDLDSTQEEEVKDVEDKKTAKSKSRVPSKKEEAGDVTEE